MALVLARCFIGRIDHGRPRGFAGTFAKQGFAGGNRGFGPTVGMMGNGNGQGIGGIMGAFDSDPKASEPCGPFALFQPSQCQPPIFDHHRIVFMDGQIPLGQGQEGYPTGLPEFEGAGGRMMRKNRFDSSTIWGVEIDHGEQARMDLLEFIGVEASPV